MTEAVALFRRSRDEILEWGGGAATTGGYHGGWLAQALIELDDLDGAQAAIDGGRIEEPEADSARILLAGRGELALARGEDAAALEIADRMAAPLGPIELPAWAMWRTIRARALAGLGRSAEARATADEDLAFARRWGAPSSVGAALRIAGAVTPDPTLAIARLREAAATLARSPARLEHAKALLALGERLSGAERELTLRDAAERARACGAPRVQRRAGEALAGRAISPV